MKKATSPKKLVLNKKTIMKLNVQALRSMLGGVEPATSKDPKDPKCATLDCNTVGQNYSCHGNCNSAICSEPGCRTF